MRLGNYCAALAVCGALSMQQALAWGPEGHAMIADMAEQDLRLTSVTATAEITKLLASEGHLGLDDISSWADDYRSDYDDTGPWHFVDIPLNAKGFDNARDCHYDKNNNHTDESTCVVAKLVHYTKILADHKRSDGERLTALKFVVHFVGDIHQPLHAEDNNDLGGNSVALNYANLSTNLHAAWDSGIIELHYGWKPPTPPDYGFVHKAVKDAASDLNSGITAAQAAEWAPKQLMSRLDDAVAEWANESHALAPAAYSHLPPKSELQTPGWEDGYEAYALPVVQERIAKASVRLAIILKAALDPGNDAPLTLPAERAQVLHWPSEKYGNTTGYFSLDQLKVISKWPHRPPAEGTDPYAKDLNTFHDMRPLIQQGRGKEAMLDDVWAPEQVLARFSEKLGGHVAPEQVPTLIKFFALAENDGSNLVSSIKLKVNVGGRIRPFVMFPEAPNCLTPPDNAAMRASDLLDYSLDQSGSFPSTHALIGALWGRILGEMVPEQAAKLRERGDDFGKSRIVCGYHWESDVVAGRKAGAELAVWLIASDLTKQDFNQAKSELRAALGKK